MLGGAFLCYEGFEKVAHKLLHATAEDDAHRESSRGIFSTEGGARALERQSRAQKHRVVRLALEIRLPGGFPEKHREGVVRAADLCAVKKHILSPPAFEIRTV